MTDFEQLKEIFEMSEVLENETETTLTLRTVEINTDKIIDVEFNFVDGLLESVTTELQ